MISTQKYLCCISLNIRCSKNRSLCSSPSSHCLQLTCPLKSLIFHRQAFLLQPAPLFVSNPATPALQHSTLHFIAFNFTLHCIGLSFSSWQHCTLHTAHCKLPTAHWWCSLYNRHCSSATPNRQYSAPVRQRVWECWAVFRCCASFALIRDDE